jgi:hypothetical protein
VEEVGQYALRGGIVDVFGFGAPEPVRIEFLGDEVESIRFFDILTQLSVRPVDSLQLLPVDLRAAPTAPPRPRPAAAGANGARCSTTSPDAVLVHLDPAGTAASLARTWTEVRRLHAAAAHGGPVDAPERLFLPPGCGGAAAPRLRAAAGGRGGELPQPAHVAAFRAGPPEAVDRDMERLGEVLRRGSRAASGR